MPKSQAEVQKFISATAKNGVSVLDGSLPGVKAIEVLLNTCGGRLGFMRVSKELFEGTFELCQEAIKPESTELQRNIARIDALGYWDKCWDTINGNEDFRGQEIDVLQSLFTSLEMQDGQADDEIATAGAEASEL